MTEETQEIERLIKQSSVDVQPWGQKESRDGAAALMAKH
jgi:hypothetical protein